MSSTTSNFLFVLIDNHRMGHFAEIRQSFQEQLDNRLGITQAEITTAVDLDADIHARLESTLSNLTGSKVVLKFSKEPDLIGGVVTRIGDTIYDGSIRQQLSTIKSRLSSD
jgi:F-type H+-transporting ATPase subunit delta